MKKATALALCALLIAASLTGCSLVRKAVSGVLPARHTPAAVTATAVQAEPTAEPTSAPTPEPTPVPTEEPTQPPAELRAAGECISAGDDFTLALRKDGTVAAVGNGSSGQCDVKGWKDIIAVSAGRWHSVGLKSDGTVVATGDDNFGQCGVTSWKNIVSVSAGDQHTAGLTADGRVLAAGDNAKHQRNVKGWSGIIAVSCGGWHTVGLKSDGTVVATGDNSSKQCEVAGWSGIVAVFAGQADTYGLKADGTVVSTYAFDGGAISSWKNVVSLAVGSFHTAALMADGSVCTVGLDNGGECNLSGWNGIQAISAGYKFSIGLREDGTMVAAGDNGDGQCDVQTLGNVGFPGPLPVLSVTAQPGGSATSNPQATASETFHPSSEHVLTIRKIMLKDISVLGEVTAEDETGKKITLPADYNGWFKDGKLDYALLAGGGSFTIGPNGLLELDKDCLLNVYMTIGGVKYCFQVGVGMQFNYTMVDGKVKLLVDDRFIVQ